MNKRLSVFILSCLWMTLAQGQLSISLQEPPAGIVQKDQLWNIALIYASNDVARVTIGLSLFDAKNNQPVMTALSNPLTITKGVKQLKASDVAPIQYNYLSSVFNNSRIPNGLLPIGSYRACYTIYADAKSVILAEDCMIVEVQPLSPPQLNMPADSALLETAYPQFNWLPPAPVTLFSDLNYDLLVTEVLPGQSVGAAIQENLPVYSVQRYTAMVNNYPASYKSLDTGKIYAWRVVAKNGEMFAAQSDIWTFKIEQKNPENIQPANGMYLELKANSTNISSGIIPDNILGVKYYSYDKAHPAKVRFLNERKELIKEIDKQIMYGNNFLVFRLDHSFDKGEVYYVEIADLQHSKHSASFSISK